MKKLKLFFMSASLFSCLVCTSQDFENISLQTDTFWDGSDFSGGFTSGMAYFPNIYDTSFGFGYWAAGWAVSNREDTVTQPSDFSTQLFNAKPGLGHSSVNYAVGQQNSWFQIQTGATSQKYLTSFYISNTTFAYNSMTFGDFSAKKFGGLSGNDPDYFKVTLRWWNLGVLANDSIEFYLADFRYTDNDSDYIVKDWVKVDCNNLAFDSIQFTLNSSDVGAFGINTPTFFVIDDVEITDINGTNVTVEAKPAITLYPNPTTNRIYTQNKTIITEANVFDQMGRKVIELAANKTNYIDVAHLPAGNYFLKMNTEQGVYSTTIIKN